MGRTGSGQEKEETTAIDIDSIGHLCSCREDFPFWKLLLPKLAPLSLAQALYPSPQMLRLWVNLPHSNLTSLPKTYIPTSDIGSRSPIAKGFHSALTVPVILLCFHPPLAT